MLKYFANAYEISFYCFSLLFFNNVTWNETKNSKERMFQFLAVPSENF